MCKAMEEMRMEAVHEANIKSATSFTIAQKHENQENGGLDSTVFGCCNARLNGRLKQGAFGIAQPLAKTDIGRCKV